MEGGMAKRNLTVQLDEDVVQKAKVLAARRGTSISGLVARELEELVAWDARDVQARHRAVEFWAAWGPRGGRTWRRDELHER
jgi:hypothetical protein